MSPPRLLGMVAGLVLATSVSCFAQRAAVHNSGSNPTVTAYVNSTKGNLVIFTGERNFQTGRLDWVNRVTIYNNPSATGLTILFNKLGYPHRILGRDGSHIDLNVSSTGTSCTAVFRNSVGVQVGAPVTFSISGTAPRVATATVTSSVTARGFKMPSLSDKLKALPTTLAGNPTFAQLESAFGTGVGSGVHSILDLGGETIDNIITRVLEIAKATGSPVGVAKQLASAFLQDVLNEMAALDTSGKLQLALDVRTVIDADAPLASRFDLLKTYGQRILGKLNSTTLKTWKVTLRKTVYLSAEVFYPRPAGISESIWLQAAAITRDIIKKQGGLSCPFAAVNFNASGMYAKWVDLPVPQMDLTAAQNMFRSLYGTAPWQIKSLTWSTR